MTDFQNLGIEEQEALVLTKLRDIRKKVNQDSWSDNMELLMKKWGEKAAGLRFMHLNSAKLWQNFSNQLSLICILITGVGSGLSLITTSVGNENIKNELLFSIAGIGFLSTLFQSLKKFYNSEEKAATHYSISKQFGSFYRYMTLQMSMSRADRDSADILTSWALKEYERLQQEAPIIENHSIDVFKNKFKNSKQTIPDVAEDKFIITIVKNNSIEVDSKEIQVSI
jgi:hypothetical protein